MDKAIIGLIGVFLGAALSITRELWLDYRSQKKKAEYLAILVACILDRYVDGCVSVVSDNGLTNQDGITVTQVTTPDLDLNSIDVDWQSLPSDLMYEILSFPNLIEEANHKISSVAEYVASPPDFEEVYEERHYEYAILGIKAAQLAEKFRQTYSLPIRDFNSWNPIEYMKQKKAEISSIRLERERAHASFIAASNIS